MKQTALAQLIDESESRHSELKDTINGISASTGDVIQASTVEIKEYIKNENENLVLKLKQNTGEEIKTLFRKLEKVVKEKVFENSKRPPTQEQILKKDEKKKRMNSLYDYCEKQNNKATEEPGSLLAEEQK